MSSAPEKTQNSHTSNGRAYARVETINNEFYHGQRRNELTPLEAANHLPGTWHHANAENQPRSNTNHFQTGANSQ